MKYKQQKIAPLGIIFIIVAILCIGGIVKGADIQTEEQKEQGQKKKSVTKDSDIEGIVIDNVKPGQTLASPMVVTGKISGLYDRLSLRVYDDSGLIIGNAKVQIDKSDSVDDLYNTFTAEIKFSAFTDKGSLKLYASTIPPDRKVKTISTLKTINVRFRKTVTTTPWLYIEGVKINKRTTYVAPGTKSFLVQRIKISAENSSEDILFSSIVLDYAYIDDGGCRGAPPVNCALYKDDVTLMTGENIVNPRHHTEAEIREMIEYYYPNDIGQRMLLNNQFVLDEPLEIKKGETINLDMLCDIPDNNSECFNCGLNIGAAVNAVAKKSKAKPDIFIRRYFGDNIRVGEDPYAFE